MDKLEKTTETMPFQTGKMTTDQMQRTQEIFGSIMSAKRFPRDIDSAMFAVRKNCQRVSFAKLATFAYEKGKDKKGKPNIVSGGSIRLAEMLAQCLGNFKYGFRIISQDEKESKVEAFAWDMEFNTFVSREFVVKHEFKSFGKTKKVTDERAVYELVANKAQRRVRACIFEAVPGDILEEALALCRKTELQESKKAPEEVRAKIIESFEQFNVTEGQLVDYFKRGDNKFTDEEVVTLRSIWRSIKAGDRDVSDFFETDSQFQKDNEKVSNLSQKINTAMGHDGEAIPNPFEKETKTQGGEFMSAPVEKKKQGGTKK